MVSPKVLFCTLSAATLLALPMSGQAKVNVEVEIAPPAAVYEAVPPPRAGYIWAPGYWDWDAGHHKHVWRNGHYVRGHRDEHWVPYAWAEHGGRYRLNEGHWERDHR